MAVVARDCAGTSWEISAAPEPDPDVISAPASRPTAG